MAISDTITSMYDNIENVYDILELAGADLTNVDKNIENLKQSWEERLLYFLANGTDVIWNNWLPKINGTGETITLNNTIEAKMDFVYKGNTSQTGTPTPDTPIPVQVVSGDNSIKVEGKNLFDKNNITRIVSGTISNDVITSNAISSNWGGVSANFTGITLLAGTYYISLKAKLVSGTTNGVNKMLTNLSGTTTVTKPALSSSYQVYCEKIETNQEITLSNIGLQLTTGNTNAVISITDIMVSKSNNTTYTPYVSQTYPINLGSMELCKIGNYQDKIAKSSGKNLYGTAIKTDSTTGSSYTIITDTSDKLEIQGISSFYSGINKKYQLQPNTQYTISLKYSELGSKSKARIYYKLGNDCENITVNDNNGYIDIGTTRTSLTFTTDSTGLVVIMFMCNFDTNSGYVVYNDIQLEKGNSSSDYEPYGKVWYLNKQIGKITYDGTEDWGLSNNVFYKSNSTILQQGNIKSAKSNYFQEAYNQGSTSNVNTYNPDNSICGSTAGTNRFYIKCTSITSIDNFKTWLSTHNTTVYYVLATPTYTKITDELLTYQLEQIKYSYLNQTNISQTNNDMPFILDVTALGN